MTDPQSLVATATDFHQPFVGHLPGYLAVGELTAPGPPSEALYDELLMAHWRALLDSPASRDERLLHRFLERHPSLLPGSNSVDGDSGHAAFPLAVITKPKLPGLSDRQPDFMWLASDSGSFYPILIEIETPDKQWFYKRSADIHGDLTHAQGQLAEWRAWFRQGHNLTTFMDMYQVPIDLRELRFSPRFVLIHGRRADYARSRLKRAKAAELAREGERLMSFDRLTPAKWGALYSCVRQTIEGYKVVAVPPCLTIENQGDEYRCSSGWQSALADCPDMAPARRAFLQQEIDKLIDDPDVYSEKVTGGLTIRRPQWL
jgi:hypothetical protein